MGRVPRPPSQPEPVRLTLNTSHLAAERPHSYPVGSSEEVGRGRGREHRPLPSLRGSESVKERRLQRMVRGREGREGERVGGRGRERNETQEVGYRGETDQYATICMVPASRTQYPWQGIVVILHLSIVCIALHHLNVVWYSQQHMVQHCPLPLQSLQVRCG